MIKIKPFTQTVWLSGAAKSTWEKTIHDCSQLMQDLEVESVVAGQRKCSWQTIRRETLPDFTRKCAEKGLIVYPVQFVGSFEGFIHYTPPGDESIYCVIAKRLDDAIEFHDRYKAGDHNSQGDSLGFPACCGKEFSKNWKAGDFDPVYSVWENSNGKVHPFSNPALRYIGLRIGFHIPCSFACPETVKISADRLTLAPDQSLVKLLTALLSMPMEWDSYRGIVVVRTPIFFIIAYTTPIMERKRFSIPGDFIPKEAEWDVS